ncbi:MAG TPA: porin family protein [Flavobacterium sp.]|nr:porin family protein [Flavobacterium sp.]
MKKLLLSALCISAFAISSAQTEKSFGVKGGVNFTNLYTKDVDDNNMLISFNAGLVAILPITDMIALQPEVIYSGKGAELKYDNAFATGNAKFRLSYIELPVLLRFNLTENFSLQAGPYLSYLVNADIKSESDNDIFNSQVELDTNDFNKFDYGLAGGVEFDLNPIGIGARYNYGLANIGKERTIGGSTYTFPDAKNSTFSVYVVFKF